MKLNITFTYIKSCLQFFEEWTDWMNYATAIWKFPRNSTLVITSLKVDNNRVSWKLLCNIEKLSIEVMNRTNWFFFVVKIWNKLPINDFAIFGLHISVVTLHKRKIFAFIEYINLNVFFSFHKEYIFRR